MDELKIKKAPLEAWITRKIGVRADAFTEEALRQYQLQKLRETIQLAVTKSPFYRKLLKGFRAAELASLADLQRLPFTSARDIRESGLQFLCVSQDDISRVVTLDSSGTTGSAKRIFFTAADQELTIDYFQYGMAALAEEGDRVLILFPGERPGSLGILLAIALKRLGAEPIPHGVVRDIPATLATMVREKVNCLVGIPTQSLGLARYADQQGLKLRLKSALLSSDYVPHAVVRELGRLWGCPIYDHYGMTELGLGGGTECAALDGYHLHEADLYFEIIDPLTGEVLPAGKPGEVVVTTLTRQGMPLIRYRTGDISRFLPTPCACGAIIRRLEKITCRKDQYITLQRDQHCVMSDFDEALFAIERIVDFSAAVDNKCQVTHLTISAQFAGRPAEADSMAIAEALDKIGPIRLARKAGTLQISIVIEPCDGVLKPRAAKRAIMEMKETDGKQDDIPDQAWQNSIGR